MTRTLDHIIDEAQFERSYKEQNTTRSQKDVFFIWLVLMFMAVFAAHLVLNFSGTTVTGFVTATAGPAGNATTLLYSLFAVFIVVLVTALIYTGITQKD
ncbi:MAG: hypothetical protein V1866_02830 [archaeon]